MWLAVQSNKNNKPGFVGPGSRLVVVSVVGLGAVVVVQVGVLVVVFQRLFFVVQCLVSVVQFRTCQSGLVCLVCVRLLCQVSLVCVRLAVVVVFVDVGLQVGLSNVGGRFVVVVAVVGHVCVAVVGVLFVVRPSVFCGSVVRCLAHFVNEAAGSFLCTEHKTYRISEAHPFFSGGRTWLTFNNYNN